MTDLSLTGNGVPDSDGCAKCFGAATDFSRRAGMTREQLVVLARERVRDGSLEDEVLGDPENRSLFVGRILNAIS